MPVLLTWLRLLAAAVVATNYKHVPLMWSFRFVVSCFRRLVFPRYWWFQRLLPAAERASAPWRATPLAVFHPTAVHTYCQPMDIDLLLHKLNLTYFNDLDHARLALVSEMFQPYFRLCEKPGRWALFASKDWPHIPVALLELHFRKEIKVFQRYLIILRVVSWDEKWLYVVLTFVLGPRGLVVHCVVLTKYVFKHGRTTVPPAEVVRASGLWTEQADAARLDLLPAVQHLADASVLLSMNQQLDARTATPSATPTPSAP